MGRGGGGMARDLERRIAANVGKLAKEDLGHDPVIFVAERDAEDDDHLILLALLEVNRLVVAVWDLECFVCRSRSAHGLEVVEETARQHMAPDRRDSAGKGLGAFAAVGREVAGEAEVVGQAADGLARKVERNVIASIGLCEIRLHAEAFDLLVACRTGTAEQARQTVRGVAWRWTRTRPSTRTNHHSQREDEEGQMQAPRRRARPACHLAC
jgi:hypothetical protein